MAGKIGVFDSGIGGLTVAASIKKHLPNQQIIYFGDTLHLPYGDKSPGTIKSYIKAISAFLFAQECEHLVVACNSASSVLNAITDLPSFASITNVIDPVVHQVAIDHGIKKVGIIGTKRTVNSHVYRNQLKNLRPDIEVYELPTPLLAPMIEEGFVHDTIAEQVIHEYLSELPEIDALVLGCTHYPLIKREIDTFYKASVQLFDAPDVVANRLLNLMGNDQEVDVSDRFFVSDYTTSFEKTAQLFFGEQIQLEKSNLFQY